MTDKILNWIFLILWSGLIFFLSSQSDLGPKLSGIWDDIISYSFHFGEYAVLAFLSLRAFRALSLKSNRLLLIFVVIFGIIYAVSDEYHQSFVPGREASIRDIIADGLGIFAAMLFYKNFLSPSSKNQKSKTQMSNHSLSYESRIMNQGSKMPIIHAS